MKYFFDEVRSLVSLALPVSLTQLAIIGMSATDVFVAGQAGDVELAGMNLGANLWNLIIVFFMGIGFSTQPLVAKQVGAKNNKGVKHQLHQSVWMCFALGLLSIVVILLGAKLLSVLPFEINMRDVAAKYLLVMSLGALPMVLLPSLRGSLEAMNLTQPVFIVSLFAFLANIPLDYIFVKGLYGLPKLGGVGCAYASVILVWLMLFSFAGLLRWHSHVRQKHLFRNFQRVNKHTIANTFKLGLPIGISIIIELSMFCGAGMLIALFGTVQASAHAIAITISSVAFMVYMGLGQGVTIRASHFLGANQPQAAWYSIKSGMLFIVFLASIVCVVFILFNRELVELFSAHEQVIVLASSLLLYAAAFQIVDALQVAVIFALRAYHDTASPPKYQFIAFWIFGLPFGIALAFYNIFPALSGASGLWLAMVISLFIVCIMLLRRLFGLNTELLVQP